MNMAEPRELIVYIHGVSPDVYGRTHASEYQRMNDGIHKYNSAWPEQYLGIEWGGPQFGGPPRGQALLTKAQRELGGRVFKSLDDASDFSLNPGRAILNNLRPLMFYGFGDMFYYVSADGKRSVRNAIIQQLATFLDATVGWDQPISITLIGHSAGSVIAFDLAFHLFFPNVGEHHSYLTRHDCGYADAKRIRGLTDVGRLRIRRLITFGAPITMLVFRSDAVVDNFAAGSAIDPKHYGLNTNIPGADPLPGARWLNVWDKDDPIAWPVEPLMLTNSNLNAKEFDKSILVEDIYLDVSDSISRSHSEYWGSERVYKAIASRW